MAEKFSRMSVSLSTHVLDTERGEPGIGVLVELRRGEQLLASRRDRRRRARSAGRGARARPLPPGLRAALAVLPARRARAGARGRPSSRAAARVVVRMRELPRQLSAEELAELFEGRTRLVELLATREDPLGSAPTTRSPSSTEAEKLEALNAHPAIGARSGLSARSAAEQGADADPVILTELAYLNQVYEEKFGFRFVVFVNGRPKTEILEVLRGRLERAREEELETALRELVAIARDRWEKPVVDPYANEWLSFLARWLHVMAGIVWIGTSFYFVALDNHLRENESPGRSTAAASTASRSSCPPRRGCPTSCTGSSGRPTPRGCRASRCWSSSTTSTRPRTSSGRAGRSATGWSIAVSIVLLGVAWVVYDVLCRVVRNELVLGALVLGLTTLAAWGSDRAVRAAGRLRPGRRDARDDHGGERLLRDHPRPPRADPRQGGLPRRPTRARRSRPSGARCTTTT